ncbi:MAG: rod shape-determining protein MreC [Kiritimatiellae bacterium]|nr:rod shape-determining protein MreC [Kiritimatiellia bacterium]
MKARTTGTLAVAVLAAAGVLALVFWRGGAVDAAYPAEKAARSFWRGAAARLSGAWRGARAGAENVRLRREVATLAMAMDDLRRAEEENDRLRKALGYQERAGGGWVAAEVLSRGGGAASTRRTIRVGKGRSSGVRPGAVVRVPEGLVGVVSEVSAKTSEVLLITDPSRKVSCTVEGDGRVTGILCGGTDDLLVLRHLDARAEVPPRSMVLTSGLGGVFPAGIPVGTFVRHPRESKTPLREGEVLPAVDFTALEDVFIRSER